MRHQHNFKLQLASGALLLLANFLPNGLTSAKSVSLVAEMAAGQPLPRSASFRWAEHDDGMSQITTRRLDKRVLRPSQYIASQERPGDEFAENYDQQEAQQPPPPPPESEEDPQQQAPPGDEIERSFEVEDGGDLNGAAEPSTARAAVPNSVDQLPTGPLNATSATEVIEGTAANVADNASLPAQEATNSSTPAPPPSATPLTEEAKVAPNETSQPEGQVIEEPTPTPASNETFVENPANSTIAPQVETTPAPSQPESQPAPAESPPPSEQESAEAEPKKQEADEKEKSAPPVEQSPDHQEIAQPPPVVEEKQPKSETNQIKPPVDETMAKKLAADELKATKNETTQVPPKSEGEQFEFRVDWSSCPSASAESINKTLELILSTLASERCESLTRTKLRPATSKQIRGHLLEVSSMPLDLGALAYAPLTHVSCEHAAHNQSDKLRLLLDHEPADQWTSSRWRLYPSVQLDELPFDRFRAPTSGGGDQKKSLLGVGGPQATGSGHRCTKFKVESGDFYLEMLSIKTRSVYQVATSGSHTIRLVDFQVRQLYLDHGLKLNARGPKSSGLLESQTVQVMHAHNQHFRRNNWLLDMYANWLRHEYRSQLGRVLSGQGELADQLNECFETQ